MRTILLLICLGLSASGQQFSKSAAFKGAAARQGTPAGGAPPTTPWGNPTNNTDNIVAAWWYAADDHATNASSFPYVPNRGSIGGSATNSKSTNPLFWLKAITTSQNSHKVWAPISTDFSRGFTNGYSFDYTNIDVFIVGVCSNNSANSGLIFSCTTNTGTDYAAALGLNLSYSPPEFDVNSNTHFGKITTNLWTVWEYQWSNGLKVVMWTNNVSAGQTGAAISGTNNTFNPMSGVAMISYGSYAQIGEIIVFTNAAGLTASQRSNVWAYLASTNQYAVTPDW